MIFDQHLVSICCQNLHNFNGYTYDSKRVALGLMYAVFLYTNVELLETLFEKILKTSEM